MRVIAGKFHGLPLKPVPGRNTRPTGAKVKESIYNILAAHCSQMHYGLDLFAGTGALGIEAVSRGVEQMYLVDKNYTAIKTIQANIQKTHAPAAFILWKMTAQQALDKLNTLTTPLDLLILDPPYAMHVNLDIIRQCVQQQLLAPHAFIIIETNYDLSQQRPSNFSCIASKKYGQTFVEIWRFEGE